jgi:hypothetical protein
MSVVTASSLDRVFQCAAAAALPTVRSPNAYGDRGSAVHHFLERIGAGMSAEGALDLVEDDEHRALCAAIDLARLPRGTAPEVAFAYDVAKGTARELGRQLRRQYPALSPTELPGTGDAVGVSGSAVFVGDFKSGFIVTPAKDSVQLRFLALCAARAYDREEAVVEIVRIRENGSVFRDPAEFDALDLDAFAVELEEVMAKVRYQQASVAAGLMPDVVEGEHCRWCPAWSSCPAKASALVRVASGEALEPLASLLPLSPEMAGVAWVRCRESHRLLERIERACYAALDEYGSLPLPSGRELRRVTEPGNEVLDGRVVFAVVREQLDQDVAEGAIAIEATKAGLERALKAASAAGKIPPRGRAAAERRVLEAVRERGGASNPMTTRLVQMDRAQAPAIEATPPPAELSSPAPADPAVKDEGTIEVADQIRAIYQALENILRTPEMIPMLKAQVERLPDCPDKPLLQSQVARAERLAKEDAAAKKDLRGP